jgi:hypothetical protein
MAKKDIDEKVLKETKSEEPVFDLEQVLSSARFKDRRDAIKAIWTDGKAKTLKEIETMLSDFMKGKVN